MKFTFVIGTPPYQHTRIKNEWNFYTPVYHLFMEAAFTVATKILFITPARFLFNAGGTPKSWNQKMLNDPHFRVLKYVQKSSIVFPETGIVGGIAITYRDAEKEQEPIKIFVNHIKLVPLIEKVKKTNFIPLSELVFSSSSFRFTEEMYLEHPEIDEQSLFDKGHRYNLESNIFNKLEEIVFFKERPIDNEEYIQIYGRMEKKRRYMWIKKKYIQGSKNFDKYKVILPRNGSGAIGEVLSTPLICKPWVGHTATFITIGCFETEQEALNCLKFIKTKFARAMHGVLKIIPSNNKQTWRYVPQQDFSADSDIDWDKSITEIDFQLYRKYNLTEDEIEFIELNIKPMSN